MLPGARRRAVSRRSGALALVVAAPLEHRLWSVMARGLRDYLIRSAEDDEALIRDADEHRAAAHA